MYIILIILFLSVLLITTVAYFLFAPAMLEIDSDSGIYQFRIGKAIRLQWNKDGRFGNISMLVFGIKRKLNVQKQIDHGIMDEKIRSGKWSLQRFFAVLKTFRLVKCYVNIDTGDAVLNGQLFPAAYVLSALTGKTFRINFMHTNQVRLTLYNNVFSMLKAYINN